jgi:penicillin-binding protein 1C
VTRPELVGVRAAAPVLFDLLDLLPLEGEAWFKKPEAEMQQMAICKHSGYRASRNCELIDSVLVGKNAVHLPLCSFHQILHLDASGQYQVHGDCEMPANMLHLPWFVLPPLEETYYKAKNPLYKAVPDFRADCKLSVNSDMPMDFIYPKKETKIFLPRDYDGRMSTTVFKATHRQVTAQIHWHLDKEYIGSTLDFHQMELQPTVGRHRILLVDEQGNRLERYFTIYH